MRKTCLNGWNKFRFPHGTEKFAKLEIHADAACVSTTLLHSEGSQLMPQFKLHFLFRQDVEPDDIGVEFRDLHHAYLEVCKAIPDIARDLLAEGRDPLACTYIICDEDGRPLMDVPFEDVLSPAELHLRRAASIQ